MKKLFFVLIAIVAFLPNAVLAQTNIKLVKTIHLTVPDGYDAKKCLSQFADKYEKTFYIFEKDISYSNFSKVSNTLNPGDKVKIDYYQIKASMPLDDVINFLISKNSLLLGAQILPLFYEQEKDRLPGGITIYSLDKKENLYKDRTGNPYMPLIKREGTNVSFDVSFGNQGLFDSDIILCFTKE